MQKHRPSQTRMFNEEKKFFVEKFVKLNLKIEKN